MCSASAAKVAGMVAFAQQRKRDSRERLLAAAAKLFGSHGYLGVSIDDVAAAAGVSRVTFYRHFANKAALAIALFSQATGEAMPGYLSIRDENFCDPAVIRIWLTGIFAADRGNRHLLQVFTQANAAEAGFAESAHGFISDIVTGLGQRMPAFAGCSASIDERRRWCEAWLLIYEILDQSSHAAQDVSIVPESLLIDILTERFFRFAGG